MSSFEATSFLDEPVFEYTLPCRSSRNSEYPTFKAVRRGNGELDFEYHLQLAFVWDDKDEFINVVKGLSPDQDLFSELFDFMYVYDAVNCASALVNPNTAHHFNFDLMDTAMGKIQYRDPAIFDICTTPLHQAALFQALNLTRFLVHLGDSPNTRIDYFYASSMNMKDALPLNVAMKTLWDFPSMKEWTKTKSIFKLITLLCRPFMAQRVEMVRLLARKTKDLDQEFFKYMKDGKLAEMCILLLAGCRLPSASVLHCRDDIPEKEKILELLEVFNNIGDKLSGYIRIKRTKSVKVDRVASEITSLFEDSGFIVKSEDIPSRYNQRPWDYPTRLPSDSKMISVPRLLSPHALGGSSFTNKGLSPIHGARLFHNSSVPKVVQINQVKNNVIGDLNAQLYKHCSFFTTALRRVGRLV